MGLLKRLERFERLKRFEPSLSRRQRARSHEFLECLDDLGFPGNLGDRLLVILREQRRGKVAGHFVILLEELRIAKGLAKSFLQDLDAIRWRCGGQHVAIRPFEKSSVKQLACGPCLFWQVAQAWEDF